jgi:hypothetical protein
MTFQKLLANKEYTILKRNDDFLYILIGDKKYIFHNLNNELKCFSFNKFRYITILDFFEDNYSFSQLDIVALTNSTLTVNLQFTNNDLSFVLGNCLEIQNIQKISHEDVLNSEALDFVNDFDHLLPLTKWKFSKNSQKFYLIPNQQFCIEFNMLSYNTYGNNIYQIKKGNDDNEMLSFLNPYSMFKYYQYNLPQNSSNIYIGFEIRNVFQTLVIQGTKQELLEAVYYSCQTLKCPFIIDKSNDKTEIHFINMEHAVFFQKYFHLLKQQLQKDIAYFNSVTKISFEEINPISIRAKRNDNYTYPILDFQNSTTHLQLILEFILNDLNKDLLYINNLSYVPLSNIDYEQNGYEENPDDFYKNKSFN